MPHTDKGKGVIVPHHELSEEALQGLLEEFVSRDGTDSGYTKLSLQQRVDQVRRQLDRGEAVVVYNPVAQSANIIPRRDVDGNG
ncbi:MAG: YheU family protein [Desulfobacteraceae bacterium]|jgi:uncharacterized protein YheU (UPF0270 family)